MVTYIINNIIIKRPTVLISTTTITTTKRRRIKKQRQHLCLDIAYTSKSIEQQIIKRGYILHMTYKRKREG
ncbi:MAG TPA: hypothetical protein VN703_05595 [Candidatus Sulfopaludibacter sp.]|nr:hypothetical protein [Candidatus Sulfopaludibacter sp.]